MGGLLKAAASDLGFVFDCVRTSRISYKSSGVKKRTLIQTMPVQVLSINTPAAGADKLQVKMKTAVVYLCLLPTLLLTGCVTPPGAPTPPDAEMRANFGRMGILVVNDGPGIQVQTPELKSFAVTSCAMQAGFTPAVNNDPSAALLSICWIPVGMVAGATYGAVAGVSEKTLNAGLAALYAAANRAQYENELREHVIAVASQRGQNLSPVLASELAPPVTPDCSCQLMERDYSCVYARGIKTLLEIKDLSPALEGREGVNPPLSFAVDVRVRLLNLHDGQEYYDYLQYRSTKHSFKTWAADDARLFREELDVSQDQISEEIVRQIFERTSPAEFKATANLRRK